MFGTLRPKTSGFSKGRAFMSSAETWPFGPWCVVRYKTYYPSQALADQFLKNHDEQL
jgi:hypothetical protein